jgi:subtilisin family serine protease
VLTAKAEAQQRKIYLRDNLLTTSNNIQQWVNAKSKTANTQPQTLIVQFSSLPTESEKIALKQKGIHLNAYLPDNAYFAVVNAGADVSALKNTGAFFITDVRPEWKIDREFYNSIPKSNEKVNVAISFANVDDNTIRAFLLSQQATINKAALAEQGLYEVTVPGNKLFNILEWYGVLYANSVADPVPLNYESKTAGKVNMGSVPTYVGGRSLTGKGVAVGVGDNVSGITHIDLKDRIINYNPAAYTNHGVHINGIVGAAGIMDPKGEGMAPGARLIDHLYSGVWERTGAMVQAYNMTITNNSYSASAGSCNSMGIYNNYSKALDEICLKYPEVLHVFASGNDGYLTCGSYPKGFGTVQGGYQPAKNNIVVTSTDKHYNNATDASRGPIKDGRLKPEITAVGVNVRSTTRTEDYLTSGGTSMASPAVAGALALLTERYKQLNSDLNPRADVLKALILNGANDIGNPGPDYRFGFGFLNLRRSLLMLESNAYQTRTITNGEQHTISIDIPANTAQLKVMLYWHDAPANPASSKQLVNDLDVTVQSPTATHKPLVLDPTPANILNNAVEGEDHINNCEQVVINSPAAGTYNINISGFSIPSGAQDYVIAYDKVPSGVVLTYPTDASAVKAGDSLLVYWDAPEDETADFTLAYSTDDGVNWQTIANNIPGTQRVYTWMVPDNINSGLCRMRIDRNGGSSFLSGRFVINKQPVVNISATQCPGYFSFDWEPVPNAGSYQILWKQGPEMQVLGEVTSTSFVLKGLSLDSFYYVAVRPMVNDLPGYRSLAVKRKPDAGDCAGSISDGDLMMERLITKSGRLFTSSALSSQQPVQVIIRNLDDEPCNSYRVTYNVNGGLTQASLITTDPIPARSTKVVTLPITDMSEVGEYRIVAAVENTQMNDPVERNNTLVKTIRQIANAPVTVQLNPTVEDFEDMAIINTTVDTIGINPDGRWDYANSSDTGRIRSFVDTGIVINGSRSISMDAYKNTPANLNELTGTYNLGQYNAANDEIRFDFDYILHSRPRQQPGNDVWVRGNDTAKWIKVYSYKTDEATIGTVQNSGTISISDALRYSGQQYSSSFQLKFGQRDSTLIAQKNYGAGLTLDDVKLYTVQNDVQLLSILNPRNVECGSKGNVPLRFLVYNGVSQDQQNVQLYYQINNGTIINENIGTLTGKDSLYYTTKNLVDMTAFGSYTINAWLLNNGDSYKKNDSVLNYVVHNQPLITIYPYFEDFERNDGYWYAEGQNSSWEYGTPTAPKINKAASGTKAWVTNLDGNYNPREQSYLYSPCFDLSNLQNPFLSFMLAYDIENCGAVLCDAAQLEYTFNGVNWQRLGKSGEGESWYNDTLYNAWSAEDSSTWRRATIRLPKGTSVMRLRYMFVSDPGAELEGIGIDDIQIFDKLPVEPSLVSVSPNPTRDGKIRIRWQSEIGVPMTVHMFDIMGKRVFEQSFTATAENNESEMQTPQFESGVYVLKLFIGSRKFTYKIVYLKS